MDYSATSPGTSSGGVTGTGTATNKNISHYAQTLTYLLGELKHVFDQQDDPEIMRVAAYERLAEISKIMRVILEKYSLLKSKELLINASRLVQAVKTYDYQNYSLECHSKLVDNINALYRSFQFNLSNCLVQNVTMASVESSMNPSATVTATTQPGSGRCSKPLTRTIPVMKQQPDERIFSNEKGLDEMIKQAKAWSKFLKEIVGFIEKRIQTENEYNRNLMKNAQSLRTSIHQMKNDKIFLPLHGVYDQFLQHEMRNANICDDNFDSLIKHVLSPVNDFRVDIDKQVKKIKDDWAKETKQLTDAVHNYTKSRELAMAKFQETDKSKHKTSDLNSNWGYEVDANCTKQLIAWNSQKELFKKAKRDTIIRLQNLLANIETRIKEITYHYFETLRDSFIYSPEQIEKALNESKNYELGRSYREFAQSLSSMSHNSLHNHIVDSQEVDSSESDNNSSFLNKNRKDSKTIAVSSKHMLGATAPEFKSSKTIEKKYKSCYGHYTAAKTDERKPFFGVPLTSLSNAAVPDIIKQCVKQIETRGSRINGIYRVSAVKSQVENLCNSYETKPESVDLSNVSPNVIANFLKHFFRMLPEPLLTFQLYPELIEMATKYSKNQPLDEDEVKIVVNKLKKLIHRMPPVHYNTLKFLMRHLKEISKDSAFNQMNPSNLGIVFGPTLLKKNDDDNTALLYDTNHQSRVIELLIQYFDEIFDSHNDSQSMLTRTSSFGSADKSVKSDDRQMGPANGDTNVGGGGRMPHLLKSATCSAIRPESISHETKRNDINEARLKFFTSSVNASSSSRHYSPSSDSTGKVFKNEPQTMSPFSQISAAATAASANMNHRMKRVTSMGHHFISNQTNAGTAAADKPNINQSKVYNKHNELSKSSSDIYSYKNVNISLTSNSEDHV